MLSVSSVIYRERPDSKKAGFRSSGLNLGSCFMSQDEGMSETCVEIQEETLVPASSGQGASHPLTPREARGVQGFKC